MKKIILLLVLSFGFMSCDMVLNSYYEDVYSGHELYDWGIPKMDSFEEVADYVKTVINYTSTDNDYIRNSIKTLYRNGYGDCDIYSLIFSNVAHFALNIDCGIAISDSSNSNQKSIGSGGLYSDHVVVYWRDKLYSPYTGKKITEYGAMYYYDFNTLYGL